MKIKISLTVFILILFLINPLYSQDSYDTLFVATWNMENLFDAIDDVDKNDAEFLPDGKKEWTQDRINSKIKNQAKVIQWMNNGNGPDILGIQEVEHQHLIDTLLQRHFGNRNYKVAYKESLDKRGIDNGLIYDADKFELLEVKPIKVELPSKYPTRYILLVKLKTKNEEEIYVFVNHWPSRSGGEERSRQNRIKAASVLRAEIDSLYSTNSLLNIIILGDFNDEPNNLSISKFLGAQKFSCSSIINPKRLYNLAYNEFAAGKGTYLYRGDWNMLDNIIVSSELVCKGKIKYLCKSFKLVKPVFMITKNGKYKGASTPTFGGKTYIGGYSDHIPVGAKFLLKK